MSRSACFRSIYRLAWTFVAAFGTCGGPALAADPAGPIRFEKRVLTDRYYSDGINAGDFNRDGKADIVAGPFWYEGPDFTTAHEFYPAVPLPPEKSPSNSMYSFVHDFSGDGWDDILVLGRVHLHAACWYENPRSDDEPWRKHFVFERVRGESPTLADVDGDGRVELVCHWDNRWGLLRPDPDNPRAPWTFHPIMPQREDGEWPQFYHGTGLGDVDGDGRTDLLLNDGWWRQPSDANADWEPRPFRFATKGGAQMFADDVDSDGRADVITSLDGHGWGLAWFRQQEQGAEAPFEERLIMGDRSQEDRYGAAFSQVHALDLADVDGDGLMDIVTGKRMWAHGPTGDIEPSAPPVVYWFQRVRDPESGVRFVPHLVDDQSGVGVQVVARDVNGDGRCDILAASKLGAFVFLQRP